MANKKNKQKSADRVRQQAAAQRAAIEGDNAATVSETVIDQEQLAAEKEAAKQKRIEERQAEIAKKQKAAEKDRKKAESQAKKRAKKSGNEFEEYKKGKEPEKEPNFFSKLLTYLKNVRAELKRVTWPTKQEVWKMSVVVVIALVFFGVLFFVVDSILNPVMVWFGGLTS